MATLNRDRSHLRSASLSDVVPRGLGNTVSGRFLREHERIISAHFAGSGIEVTELTRILTARLGRVAWQIAELERRLDKDGKLGGNDLRIYTSLTGQYTGVIRELVLHRHRHKHERSAPQRAPSQEPSSRPSLADILAEMGE
jgi:hypothetical protein